MDDTHSDQVDKTREVAQPAIRTVADLERDFEKRRLTLADRLGDIIGGFAGSFAFVIIQIAWISAWILGNLGLIPGAHQFDPPPFYTLQLAVAIESIFLVTFVLMRENRMRRSAQAREQLELQINLLAERESTEILQLLMRIANKVGLEELTQDEERQHLSQRTHVETLAHELEDNLPGMAKENGKVTN